MPIFEDIPQMIPVPEVRTMSGDKQYTRDLLWQQLTIMICKTLFLNFKIFRIALKKKREHNMFMIKLCLTEIQPQF
jgi:hypothetical protein